MKNQANTHKSVIGQRKSGFQLGDHVRAVRSKNAGPFWLTVDIFCGDAKTYSWLLDALTSNDVAHAFAQPIENILRFNIKSLHVIKFSLPRPAIQGSRLDRDMHGAQWAVLISELTLE